MDDHVKIGNAIKDAVLRDHSEINLAIVYSDNLNDDGIPLCENTHYRRTMIETRENERKKSHYVNGMYLPPSKMSGTHYAMISNRLVNPRHEYIATIAHETKHAVDFTDFCARNCNGDFELIFNHPLYSYLCIWSEFNAHRISQEISIGSLGRKISRRSLAEIEKQMREDELPKLLDRLNKCIAALNAGKLSISDITMLLAKFAAWQRIFSIDVGLMPHDYLDLYNALNYYYDIMYVDWNKIVDSTRKLHDDGAYLI